MPNVHMAAATLAAAQLNDEHTSETYQTEEGMTDEVMQFAALNRIAEAQLATAYELRTKNLLHLLDIAIKEEWQHDGDGRMIRAQILEALDITAIDDIIDGRHGVV